MADMSCLAPGDTLESSVHPSVTITTSSSHPSPSQQIPLSMPQFPVPAQTQTHFNYEALPPGAAQSQFLYSDKPKEMATVVIQSASPPARSIARTPSPTPSEQAFLNRKGLVDWQKMKNWRWWFRKEWIWRYVIGIIVIVFVTLLAVYDKNIVHALEPAAKKLRDLPAGWLIPIAIFFVISFPPLFGHEILAMLCGVIWGFWIGFGITAAGTLVGEIGNFYAFRWCLRSRGEKYERKNIQYGCLARVIRDGGFKMALVARYSAVPGHLLTAIFSTAGINILLYIAAAVLSLPKQAALVIVGVALEESGDGTESTEDRIVSAVTITVTSVVTYFAMRYIFKKINEVKGSVIYDRRKWRGAKMEREREPQNSLSSDDIENASIPLHVPTPSRSYPPPASDGSLVVPMHEVYASSSSSIGHDMPVQHDQRYAL